MHLVLSLDLQFYLIYSDIDNVSIQYMRMLAGVLCDISEASRFDLF